MIADRLPEGRIAEDGDVDEIIAALDAAGFVIVPKEPTEAMEVIQTSPAVMIIDRC